MKTNGKHNKNKLLIIIFCVFALLMLSLHLYIHYKSKALIEKTISNLSKQGYSVKFSELQLSYSKLTIRLTGVSITPRQSLNDPKTYSLLSDTVLLKLNSILSLLISREIDVNEFAIVNTGLTIHQKHSLSETSNATPDRTLGLSQQLKEIQDKLLVFLKAWNVKNCRIQNVDFQYYPYVNNPQHYNVENIYLQIDDLHLRKSNLQPGSSAKFGAHINLKLLQPNIQHPDSNLQIAVDKCEWDSRQHYIQIDNFSLRQKRRLQSGNDMSIRLGLVRLAKMDWQAWLDSGMVRMDTLLASAAAIQLESSKNDTRNEDTLRSAKNSIIRLLSPIQISNISIISFTADLEFHSPQSVIRDTLVGDSLVIKEFMIDSTRAQWFGVKSLNLVVRKYANEDRDRTFRSAFGKLTVNEDSIILSNYVLQTLAKSKFGRYNILIVPSLIISGISLDDLLSKKLSARELRLDNPYLEMNLVKKLVNNKPDPGKTRKLLTELQPYMQVERLIINNASITIHDKAQPALSFGSHNFSGIIYTKPLLQSQSPEDIFRSIAGMKLDNVFLKTPHEEFRMFGGQVDQTRNRLTADSIKAYLSNRKVKASLADVELLLDDMAKSFNKPDPWHISMLKIGHGRIDADFSTSKANAAQNYPSSFQIDSIRTGKLELTLQKNDMKFASTVNSLYANTLIGEKGNLSWQDVEGNFGKMILHTG